MSTLSIYDKELAPLVIKNMPSEIHLNLGDDLYIGDLKIDFNDLDDITWSEEKCTRTDIRYIREDETKYIGKKHIEGNKIYADSSIVEFEIRLRTCTLPIIGYFQWNNRLLNYQIIVLDDKGDDGKVYGGKIIPYSTYSSEIFDIKIIDTIQENKLGLIKKDEK